MSPKKAKPARLTASDLLATPKEERRRLVLYVAGPYRSKTGDEWEVQQNIHTAGRVARELWRRGFSVVCPHTNTANMGWGDKESDEAFLAGTMELMRRCDGVVLYSPRTKESKGTVAELCEAIDLDLPILVLTGGGKHLINISDTIKKKSK